MKRVLLLGDSIRMGYDSMVKELLSDKYEVFFSNIFVLRHNGLLLFIIVCWWADKFEFSFYI